MANLIFFDTETTGNTENDFLCQLAYKTDSTTFSSLYKPSVKIPPEASAVHHITNKMVADKKSFKESPDYTEIKKLFENPNNILVAHNAPFDLLMLQKEDIVPKNFICTLRLVRHLDPDEEIEKYNLQYLRYFWEVEIEANAHDALGDVLVLEKIYETLKNKLIQQEKLNEAEAIKKMMEISSHPSLFKTIKFGKYNGKQIEDILRVDRGYLEWLLEQKIASDQIDEDWIYTLKHYLNK